jgi:hypothetical protein
VRGTQVTGSRDGGRRTIEAMTLEPMTTAIGRSAQARLAQRTSGGDRVAAVAAPVPRAVQVWIVATLFAGALLTGCASAERAGGPTTTTTTTTTTIASSPG